MTHPRSLLFASLLGLVAGALARADAPKIAGIAPYGVKRGAPAEVLISGSGLAGKPRLIAPFAFKIIPPKVAEANPAQWKLALDVDPATPIGVYVVRVQTDDGLSNPFLFAVGQLDQVGEKEDNSRFELAQPVTIPCVVEGTAAGTDVDYFRFTGKKGQKIVVDAQCARIGSGVDPTIRLTTASHKFVASADDTPGLLTDARLATVLPADGEYVVELSDTRYQGGGRPIYRLLIGDVPMAEEVYPLGGRRGETVGFELQGGTMGPVRVAAARLDAPKNIEMFHPRFSAGMLGMAGSTLDVESVAALALDDYPEVREPADPAAPPVKAAPPVVLNGRIESRGDVDTFLLAVTPGQRLRFDVSASDLGSALDGVLDIKGPGGNLLASADDTTTPTQGKMKNKKAPAVVSPDPAIDFTVPAGMSEIQVSIRDLKREGGVGYGYRIGVEPIVATFDVATNESELSIPQGGTVAIGVTVARKGYNGPITIDLANPPRGITTRPGSIAPGQVAGFFTITAAPDLKIDRIDLDVVGKAAGPAGPLTVSGSKLLVFSVQGTLPTNVVTQVGLPAAGAIGVPIAFETPTTPVELAHGFGGVVPIKVIRGKGGEGAITIVSAPLPPGFGAPGGTIADKASEGAAVVATGVEAPLGPATLVLMAKGRIAGADRLLALPTVSVVVVRPTAVELPGSVDVKQGATVELKGKLVRKGSFKEPVVVKLEGLPAGLKADAVTVAPDKSEFVVKLVADAKAAITAAPTPSRVVLVFQANKKDYPTPPTPLAVKIVAK